MENQIPAPLARFCTLPVVPQRTFSPDVHPKRAHIILATSLKWVNGTNLRYYFFSEEKPDWYGGPQQEAVVRKAFNIWKEVGIGITFEEVFDPEESDVRIGFKKGDGAWSYVGRDIWDISKKQRTMNFGWNIAAHPSEIDTALHEIGHTLGLYHEHQNPKAGIVWNEEAVYEALSQAPNFWDRQTTFQNIISKNTLDEVEGSVWDPNSIMHYPFESGLIQEPAQYRKGIQPKGGLSAKDREYMLFFYPPIEEQVNTALLVFQSEKLTARSGEQQDFYFVPNYSKKYKIQTFGDLDTLIVLFEEDKTGELIYLSGDDDSGTDFNANLKLRLIKGRKYIIRVRILYRGKDGSGGIVIS